MEEHGVTVASFWGHLAELRLALLRIFFIILSSIVICFIYREPLIDFFKKPFLDSQAPPPQERLEYIRISNSDSFPKTMVLPENSLLSKELSTKIESLGEMSYQVSPGGALVFAKAVDSDPKLIVLSPLEGLLISFKISLWIGTFLTSPLWLFALTQFLLPGLRKKERQLLLPFIVTSLTFISLGCLFAYLIVIPLTNEYLAAFNGTIGNNLWSLENYLDYTLFLLLSNGIAFEIGAIGIFAVHLGIVSREMLVAKRHFAYLGAFILAAILTPPDVITQFLLAIPLIALYETLIFYGYVQKRLSL